MSSISCSNIPRQQAGAALMLVLVLLVVMTLLALASVRATQMGERMSGNLYDRSLAFQAAESALREAEASLTASTAFPSSGTCDSSGLCPAPTATSTSRWLDSSTSWKESTVSIGGLTAKPQFIIEPMGSAPNWPGCDREIPQHASCLSPRFRITARSQEAGRAQVLLQSNYTIP